MINNKSVTLLNNAFKHCGVFKNQLNKTTYLTPSTTTTTNASSLMFSNVVFKNHYSSFNKSSQSLKFEQYQNSDKRYRFGSGASSKKSNTLTFKHLAVIAGATVVVGSSGLVLCQEKPYVVPVSTNAVVGRTVSEEEYEELVQTKRNKKIVNVAGAAALSGFLGYSAGYATKRLGRVVMYVVGILFIFSQVLSYYGYITIDWKKITVDASPKFTKEKRRDYLRKFYSLLTQNLPFKVGFGSGFYLGFIKSK